MDTIFSSSSSLHHQVSGSNSSMATSKGAMKFAKEKNASSLAKKIISDAWSPDPKAPLTGEQVAVIGRRLYANKGMVPRWSTGFMMVMRALSDLHENKSHFAIALLAVLEDLQSPLDQANDLNMVVRQLRQCHYHHHFYAAGGRETEPRGLREMISSPTDVSPAAATAWIVFAKQSWFINYWARVMEDDRLDLVDELSLVGVNWLALSRAVPIAHEVQSEQSIAYLADLGVDLNASPGGHHIMHAMASRDDSAAPLVEELLRRGVDHDPAYTPLSVSDAIASNFPRSAWLKALLKDREGASSRAADRLISRGSDIFMPTNRAAFDNDRRRSLSDLIKETGAHELVRMSRASQSDPTPWLVRQSPDHPFLSEAGLRAVAALPKDPLAR